MHRYSYHAAGFLTRAETHDSTNYTPQTEMVYNDLGERVSMIGWQGGMSLTTSYMLDLTQRNVVLTTTASGNTIFYPHDNSGPLAEMTASWAYYLTDSRLQTAVLSLIVS